MSGDSAGAGPGANDPRPSAVERPAPPPVHDSILDTIGRTPLVRLQRLARGIRTPVYAKLETRNPGCSVKDRIGLAIVDDAEREGRLRRGGTVVEATSGNTGVALAMICAIRGYRAIFTMPDKMSEEKIRLLKSFGARVVITPTAVPPDSPDHYVNVARTIAESTPGAVFANQFYNRQNTDAHYRTTGPELWEQTGGRIAALVAGMGTGGTISGAGRYLKERDPAIRVVGADPVGSILRTYKETGRITKGEVYKVEGIGSDKIPGTLDIDVVDEIRNVSDRESLNLARRITREEGIFCGGSTGTIFTVALQIARELDDPDRWVVGIVADTGAWYLSKFHSDEWMRENRFLDEEAVDVSFLLGMKTRGEVPPVVTVSRAEKVRDALALMERYNISQLPVVDGDESVGSLSEGPLLSRVIADSAILDRGVGDFLEPPFPVVDDATPIRRASEALGRGGSPAVLVRSGGRLVGIVTKFDVLHFLMNGGS
ncbi:MAG TPA: pyridoxal-phosphate dependent enzyme [Gemmatimonadota bacterium]|jgi:cystathionine beta-synthase